MAEFVFGSSGYLKFGSTVLSAEMRTFDPEEEIGLVDGSAGNDANRSYLTTLKDGTAAGEFVLQTGGTAFWTAVAPGTSGTLEWGEEGTASAKPKHTVVCLVRSRKRSFPYEEVAVANIEWQMNGAVTDTTY